MSEGNGVSPKENPPAEVIERMNDASEIPPAPGPKSVPRHGARRRDMTPKPLPENAVAPEVIDGAQAAREEIYVRYSAAGTPVPEPLKIIFNKLMPEEILHVIAYVESAYNRGAMHADDGTAVSEAYARGQASVADGPPMRRLVELVEGLLQASEDNLETEQPDVGKFLGKKTKLFARFQANAGG